MSLADSVATAQSVPPPNVGEFGLGTTFQRAQAVELRLSWFWTPFPLNGAASPLTAPRKSALRVSSIAAPNSTETMRPRFIRCPPVLLVQTACATAAQR